MLTFAVVRARPGRAVPPHVRELLATAAPDDLTFVPDDHLLWSDDAGRTVVAAWQLGAEHLGVGSRWEVRADGVTAFSGHVFHDASPWSDTSTWAAQLADLCERKPLVELAPQLDGVFAALAVDRSGRGCVVADPLGIGVLYRAESPDVVVVSTRAALAARLVAPEGTRPRRDAEGAGWLAYASNLQTDRTTFDGVHTVPQGASVTLAADGSVVVGEGSLPWDDVTPVGVADLPEVLAGAVEHMRALTRTFVALPTWLRSLELTGGRDSRLILSLLLAEGLSDHVVCLTWGSPRIADVLVAGELADRFDLELRAEGRPRRVRATPRPSLSTRDVPPPAPVAAPPEPSYVDQLRHLTWLASGAVSVWDGGSKVVRTPVSSLALTGQFGEVVRTHFPRTDGLGSPEDLRGYVAAGAFGFDAAGVLRRDARRHYDAALLAQLEDRLGPGRTVRDAVDDYFVQGRLRRWFGALQETDSRNRLFPLYSVPAFRAAFAVGADARRAESVAFELMRAGADELARIPFAGRPWPAEVAPGAAAAGYPVGPPLVRWSPPPRPSVRRRLRSRLGRPRPSRSPASPVGTAGEEARMRDLEAKIPVLHELVDLDRSHPFHDVVDRQALTRAIDALPTLPFLARRAVHDAVTAAVWMSEGEAPAHRVGSVI